ncbi:DUF4097 family beta strand repeat-containing protein [Aquisphaera insulae]|uniref:DUF4097 family beta strand repeat-containing protein n=1 Tax=Aquisphaera insulae TaxID=2712864 RepID=UPI0013EAB815|nr:DUF4097 family beta strand repeat-containing protein [Aquisphaera insulae]
MIPPKTPRMALLLVPCTLLLSAGCAAIMTNMVRATLVEERSFPIAGQGSPAVIAETFNGGIKVAAIPGREVKVKVTRIGCGRDQAAAEGDIANVQVAYAQEGDTVRVVATRAGSKLAWSSAAEIELQVPTDTALTLTSRNGRIHALGVHSPIVAHTTNGEIDVRAARGKLDLETSNGRIDAEGTDAVVAATTSNGEVRFVGNLATGEHSLKTSNGRVVLAVPSSAPLHVSARTSNGRVTSELAGLEVQDGKPGTNHLVGRLAGTPKASIGSGPIAEAEAAINVRLETSNGEISLQAVPAAEATRP